ncbi:MAG: helix-turn-helix domain-containing protein [Pyrinomonadaceae bacterium]
MSVQAQSWVITNSVHKGSAFVVLLMIANHSHADGTNAFPSYNMLATECRITARQVIRIIHHLEQSGELLVVRSKGRKSNDYVVVMPGVNDDIVSRLKAPNSDKITESDAPNDDKMSELEGDNHDILSGSTVTISHGSKKSTVTFGESDYDISDANCDIAVSPESLTVNQEKRREGTHAHATPETVVELDPEFEQVIDAEPVFDPEPDLEPDSSQQTAGTFTDNRLPPVKDNVLLHMYFAAFPDFSPPIFLQETILDRVSDQEIWRQALKYWLENDYRPKSVGKLCDRYDEIRDEQSNGNGKTKLSFDEQRDRAAAEDFRVVDAARQRSSARRLLGRSPARSQ